MVGHKGICFLCFPFLHTNPSKTNKWIYFISFPFSSFLPKSLISKQKVKLSNKGIDFPFPSLKLPIKEIEEYFKIIHFIPIHFILFSLPKRGWRELYCFSLCKPFTLLHFIYLLLFNFFYESPKGTIFRNVL